MKNLILISVTWLLGGAGGLYAQDTVEADELRVTLKSIRPKLIPGAKSLHPDVVFLTRDGRKVLDDNGALSLEKSCGACHDTQYIEKHNYHAQVGLSEASIEAAGPQEHAQVGDFVMLRGFDPLIYRRLSRSTDEKLDLGKAAWIQLLGPRHVGGGPAFRAQNGKMLEDLKVGAEVSPETHVLEPKTKTPRPWDYQKSGGVELNCLLCHMQNPDNRERIDALEQGRFRWASTATLVRSGIVARTEAGFTWNRKMFDARGAVTNQVLKLSDPPSDNCRLCHAKACRCSDPVVFENSLQNWSAETTGTIFSPEPMRKSGMNLSGKPSLNSAWDVHAERLLGCIDCHHAPNNPAYNQKDAGEDMQDHLRFDARRLGIEAYLRRPDHNLVKGFVTQTVVARAYDGTMRGCRDCHRPEAVHEFLPFKKTHFEKLSCQTCHIPKIFAPARSSTDWTLLDADGQPLVAHRGVSGEINDPLSIIDGYQPVLLWHVDDQDVCRLGPHNLVTSWFWSQGDQESPIRYIDLYNALFEQDGGYHPQVIAGFDANSDGRIGLDELRLDTDEKINLMKKRLETQGVEQPTVRALMHPYTIAHGVLSADMAVKSCDECHRPAARIGKMYDLARYAPAGVMPRLLQGSDCEMAGTVLTDQDGALKYKPDLGIEKLYVHGAVRLGWTDLLGLIVLLATGLGVLLHGGLRGFTTRMRKSRGGGS